MLTLRIHEVGDGNGMASLLFVNSSVLEDEVFMLFWSTTHVFLTERFDLGVDVHVLLSMVSRVIQALNILYKPVAVTKAPSGASSDGLQP